MMRRHIGSLVLLAGLACPAWGVANWEGRENTSWDEGRMEEAGRQHTAELEDMERLDKGDEKRAEFNQFALPSHPHTTVVTPSHTLSPKNVVKPKGSISTTGGQTKKQPPPTQPVKSSPVSVYKKPPVAPHVAPHKVSSPPKQVSGKGTANASPPKKNTPTSTTSTTHKPAHVVSSSTKTLNKGVFQSKTPSSTPTNTTSTTHKPAHVVSASTHSQPAPPPAWISSLSSIPSAPERAGSSTVARGPQGSAPATKVVAPASSQHVPSTQAIGSSAPQSPTSTTSNSASTQVTNVFLQNATIPAMESDPYSNESQWSPDSI